MKKKLIYALMLTSLWMAGCKKEDDATTPDTQEEQQTSVNSNYAQSAYDDALNMSGEAMDNSDAGGSGGRVTAPSYCATVSIDRTAKTVVLDFGSGCVSPDGRTRKGVITVNYQGKYRTESSQTAITFSNYSIDGNTLSGTVTLSGVKRNANGHLQYTIAIAGSLTLADGSGSITENLTRTLEWTAGEASGSALDDVFSYTSAGNVTSKSGVYYDITTTKAVTIQSSCLSEGIVYPVSGTVSYKPKDKVAYVLDYGSGACDKVATITVGAFTKTITFP